MSSWRMGEISKFLFRLQQRNAMTMLRLAPHGRQHLRDEAVRVLNRTGRTSLHDATRAWQKLDALGVVVRRQQAL